MERFVSISHLSSRLISNLNDQVEKFIESILPSQTPEHAKRIVKKEKTAEEIKMMEEAAEARKDTFIMMGLTMGLLLVITIMMVWRSIFITSYQTNQLTILTSPATVRHRVVPWS